MRSTAKRAPPAPTFTVEEWVDMAEDEPGELVDGVLVEEEVTDHTHETAVSWLIRLLGTWVVPLGGYVFGSELKYALGPARGRKPDVTMHLPGGRRLSARGPAHAPPDVAIEVVSPSPRDRRRDRIEKADDYARFGVKWYWLVDPQERSLEVLELVRGKRYARALAVTEGRVTRVPGCPGLSLDLDALWAKVDYLEAEPPPE